MSGEEQSSKTRGNTIPDDRIRLALTNAKGLVYVAARMLGCDPSTIYRRMKQKPELLQAREDAMELTIDQTQLKLYERAMAGDAWAVQFLLKTLGKKRGFVERTELQISDEQLDDYIERELARLDEGAETSVPQAPSDAEDPPPDLTG